MRVAVLLSGGVDSAMALHDVLDAGHEAVAFYLKIWLEDELAGLGTCPWEDDLHHARAVCAQAGVPLEVVSLQRAYHEQVVAQAIDALRAGATPSPDILCNRRIKFGAFADALAPYGEFDRIASGHYARVEQRGDAWNLLRAVDAKKDQTYFLYRLDQAQLARCLFPLGSLRKEAVRARAEARGLPNFDRPDSQGICFLGKIPFDAFARSYLGERPGTIRDVDSGRVLGEHRGPWFHTIGQRRGLGLGGGPWYVVHKDLERNEILVAHHEALASHTHDRVRLTAVHWIAGEPAGLERRELDVKLRHGPSLRRARVAEVPGGLELRLARGDSGLAAGQSAVLYDGEVCLGGGTMVAAPEASAQPIW